MVTRSGTALTASLSSAKSQARRAAEVAARGACRYDGGTVIGQPTSSSSATKATDRSYRGNATATVRCRK